MMHPHHPVGLSIVLLSSSVPILIKYMKNSKQCLSFVLLKASRTLMPLQHNHFLLYVLKALSTIKGPWFLILGWLRFLTTLSVFHKRFVCFVFSQFDVLKLVEYAVEVFKFDHDFVKGEVSFRFLVRIISRQGVGAVEMQICQCTRKRCVIP